MSFSKDQTKRLISIHGWSGILLGLMLYVVLLTGAIVVFAHEIGAWSVSGVESHQPFSKPIDKTVRKLANSVKPEYLEYITIFSNAGGNIIVFPHSLAMKDGMLEELGILFELDPNTHEILHQREGYAEDVFADPYGALDDFLVEMHVTLTAPKPIGLYLTGILGLMMMLAAMSGIIIHRHMIRDLFMASRKNRRKQSESLEARDKHSLAGAWGLPFAFILAFTGSFFSFAIALGLPTLGMVAFKGDQVALIETLVGVPQQEDKTPVKFADLDSMISHSSSLAGTLPANVSIMHYGRVYAGVLISHPPAEGNLNDKHYKFNGATGEFLGLKPTLGTQPSIGSDVFNLIGPLHFGTFAGLLSKVIWFSLGIAMCYLTITGMQLWLRRRAHIPLWQKFSHTVYIVGYGLPIAIAGSAIGFFLSLPSQTTLYWTPASFAGFSVFAIVVGILIRDTQKLTSSFLVILSVLLLILPVVRLSVGGVSWADSLATNNIGVIAFDLIMFIFAGYFAWLNKNIKNQQASLAMETVK